MADYSVTGYQIFIPLNDKQFSTLQHIVKTHNEKGITDRVCERLVDVGASHVEFFSGTGMQCVVRNLSDAADVHKELKTILGHDSRT